MASESRFSAISGSDAASIFMEPIHLSSAIAAKKIIHEGEATGKAAGAPLYVSYYLQRIKFLHLATFTPTRLNIYFQMKVSVTAKNAGFGLLYLKLSDSRVRLCTKCAAIERGL